MPNLCQPLDTAVSFDPYAGEPNRDGDQCFRFNPDGTVFFPRSTARTFSIRISRSVTAAAAR